MSNVNYSNPGSFMPETAWKPNGFLGGMTWGNNKAHFEEQMQNSNIMQNLELMRKKAEYQDYQLGAPARQSKRDLDTAANTAQIPIQGALAGADEAKANATAFSAMPEAKHKQWKNDAEKRETARALLGDVISNISHLPPPEMAMAWQKQGVPFLEQQLGEPMDPMLKNADPQMLSRIGKALSNPVKQQGVMEKVGAEQAGQTLRNREDNQSRERVAGMQEAGKNARDRSDRMTEAQRKQQEEKDLREALIYQKTTEITRQRGMRPEDIPDQTKRDIENWAKIQATHILRGGNPQAKAASRVEETAGENAENARALELYTAKPFPMTKEGKIDMSKVDPNKPYKDPEGNVWKLDPMEKDQTKKWKKVNREPNANEQFIR
jgi:hypothetical protein